MAEPLTSDGRVATRGAVQRRAEELIRQGLDNRAAAAICRAELGGRTTPACIAWYRTHMRKKVAGERQGPTPEAKDQTGAAQECCSRIRRMLKRFLGRRRRPGEQDLARSSLAIGYEPDRPFRTRAPAPGTRPKA